MALIKDFCHLLMSLYLFTYVLTIFVLLIYSLTGFRAMYLPFLLKIHLFRAQNTLISLSYSLYPFIRQNIPILTPKYAQIFYLLIYLFYLIFIAVFAQDTFILTQNHPCKIQLRSSKMQKYD